MYCLDSDIIIEHFRGNEKVRLHSDFISKARLFVTPVTLCELFRGAFLSNKVQENLLLVDKLLEKVDMLQFDKYACEIFGKDYGLLKKQGKLTQDNDLMTASLCVANNITLITRNKKHYENIPHLKVEEW